MLSILEAVYVVWPGEIHDNRASSTHTHTHTHSRTHTHTHTNTAIALSTCYCSSSQDQYDKISSHTEHGIEFTKKVATFVEKRISVEHSYAKDLRCVCVGWVGDVCMCGRVAFVIVSKVYKYWSSVVSFTITEHPAAAVSL